MHPQLVKLIARAEEDLRSLGASPVRGRFVCPLCLHSRPLAEASRGHYPAEAVQCARRQVELLCRRCNSFIGTVYESDARDFLAGHSRVELSAQHGGRVRGKVEARTTEDGKSNMRMLSSKMGTLLSGVRDRSSNRDVVTVRMLNLDDRSLQRALLSWSLLDWFRYAGYRYAVSPGMAVARGLLFEPKYSSPRGLWFQTQPMELPLAAPEPVIVLRVDSPTTSFENADEYLGLGTRWGNGVLVLPFASDTTTRAWDRIAALVGTETLVRTISLPAFFQNALSDRLLRADVHLTDDERPIDIWVTRRIARAEAAALVSGTHPLRGVPRPGAAAVKSGVEYTFDVVSDGSVP